MEDLRSFQILGRVGKALTQRSQLLPNLPRVRPSTDWPPLGALGNVVGVLCAPLPPPPPSLSRLRLYFPVRAPSTTQLPGENPGRTQWGELVARSCSFSSKTPAYAWGGGGRRVRGGGGSGGGPETTSPRERWRRALGGLYERGTRLVHGE